MNACTLCGFTPASRTPHGWASGMGTHMHRIHGVTHTGETRDCQHTGIRHEHGTPQAYMSDRCRCAACIEANRRVKAAGRRDRAYGRFDRHLVPAGPTKRRIKELRAAGTPAKVIAERAGLSTTTLREITNGRRINGRHRPTIMVYAGTEAAVLAVQPAEELIHARFAPAVGTTRRLQALATLGYGTDELARRIGIAPSNLHPTVHGTNKYVQHSTAEAVRELYDELWDKPNRRADRPGRSALGRIRKLAARRGWAPPLAWDDDTIDDPAALPQGTVLPRTQLRREDIAEDVHDLLAAGQGAAAVLTATGRSLEQLVKALKAGGRMDLVHWLTTGTEPLKETA